MIKQFVTAGKLTTGTLGYSLTSALLLDITFSALWAQPCKPIKLIALNSSSVEIQEKYTIFIKFLWDWTPVQSIWKHAVQLVPPQFPHKWRFNIICPSWESSSQITASLEVRMELKGYCHTHCHPSSHFFNLYSCPLVRSNVPSDLWPKLLEQFKQIFWLQSINTVTIKGWKSCLLQSLLWLPDHVILWVVWKVILTWHLTWFTIFFFNA